MESNSHTLLPVSLPIPPPPPPPPRSRSLGGYYYDVRYLLLALINKAIRPHFALLFSDYTDSFETLLQVALLVTLLFLFLYTSLKIFLGCSLKIDIKAGQGEKNNLLVAALAVCLLCPFPIFMGVLLFIHLCSIWPFAFNLFRVILLRLQAALFLILSFSVSVVVYPRQQQPNEVVVDGDSQV